MTVTSFPHRAMSLMSLFNEDINQDPNWDDVTCPICLDFPHNAVLLQCSSHHKGCRPFMCDTDHTHTNCLNRFKSAYKISSAPKDPSTSNWSSADAFQFTPSSPENLPSCPLCRGAVSGWVIDSEARMYLDMKKRSCAEKNCSFIGNFIKLKEHAQLIHPHSRPSEIDPAKQLDWENFTQSSEIVDVLSTIHAEVPHGVVLGDYVIEYGGEETGAEENENFRQRKRSWWTSCIFYKAFGGSKSRRRSRGRSRSNSNGSSVNEGSPSSLDFVEYRFELINDHLVVTGGGGPTSSGIVRSQSRQSWRQRSTV